MTQSINEIYREDDRLIALERAGTSMVTVTIGKEKVSFVPQHGNLMGTAEAPRQFIQTFHRPVEAWSSTPGITDPRLVWTSAICPQPVDVSLTGFADVARVAEQLAHKDRSFCAECIHAFTRRRRATRCNAKSHPFERLGARVALMP